MKFSVFANYWIADFVVQEICKSVRNFLTNSGVKSKMSPERRHAERRGPILAAGAGRLRLCIALPTAANDRFGSKFLHSQSYGVENMKINR